MRWLYTIVIVLFAAAATIFAFQNLETVTVFFLRFHVTAPLGILVFIVYALGAITGPPGSASRPCSIRGDRRSRIIRMCI